MNLTAKQELIKSIENKLSDKEKKVLDKLFDEKAPIVMKAMFPDSLETELKKNLYLVNKIDGYLQDNIESLIVGCVEKEVKVKRKADKYIVSYRENKYIVDKEQKNLWELLLTDAEKLAISGQIMLYEQGI